MNVTKASKNFSLTEFDCQDGTLVPPKYLQNVLDLAENLQHVRDFFGKPVKINSGYRTPAYNAKVGGSTNSFHLLGKAADIVVPGHSPEVVRMVIEGLIRLGIVHNGGLGIYDTFCHYDTRSKPARWDERTAKP